MKSTSPLVLFRQTDLSFVDPKFGLIAIYEDALYVKESKHKDSYILRSLIGRIDTYLSTPDTIALKIYCNSGEPLTILFRKWDDATLLRKKIINIILRQEREDNYTHIPEFQKLKKYYKTKYKEWFGIEYMWNSEDSYSLAELINTINLKINQPRSTVNSLEDEFKHYINQCRAFQVKGEMKILNKSFTVFNLNKYFNSFNQIINTKNHDSNKSKRPVRGKGTSYVK